MAFICIRFPLENGVTTPLDDLLLEIRIIGANFAIPRASAQFVQTCQLTGNRCDIARRRKRRRASTLLDLDGAFKLRFDYSSGTTPMCSSRGSRKVTFERAARQTEQHSAAI